MRLVAMADGRLGVDGGAGIVDIAPIFSPDPRRPFIDPMVQLIERFQDLRPALEERASATGPAQVDALVGPPLGRPRKMVNLCTELDTVEPNAKPPIDWFFKSPESVIGTGDSVVLPPHYADGFSIEPELAVVIGQTCRDVPEHEVGGVIFGYTLVLDGAAMGVGRGMGTYFGKSMDTFCPMGPAILVAEASQDVPSFEVRMRLNGELVSRYKVVDLPHSIASLIADVSTYATLLPGDVVACGSPTGEDSEIFDGDTIDADITGIGTIRVSVADPLFRHRARVA